MQTMSRVTSEHTTWDRPVRPTSRLHGCDSISDLLKDCAQMGLMDELRAALDGEQTSGEGTTMRVVRDLIYELAGARNRDLAVDVLIHATGVAEFDQLTLRDYARKHGLSHEGFRKQVLAMQQRLNLPRRPQQLHDAN